MLRNGSYQYTTNNVHINSITRSENEIKNWYSDIKSNPKNTNKKNKNKNLLYPSWKPHQLFASTRHLILICPWPSYPILGPILARYPTEKAAPFKQVACPSIDIIYTLKSIIPAHSAKLNISSTASSVMICVGNQE